jgi:hypothetical protein
VRSASRVTASARASAARSASVAAGGGGAEGAGEVRGARPWAQGAIVYSRGAAAGRVALIDGALGIVVVPHGKLFRALRFTLAGDRIASLEVIADPKRLAALEIQILVD